jgi:hypothetical protein
MKLLIIYGPQGVGKLTVANKIAKLTGFKVFHNHLTFDAVKDIFEVGSSGFWSLIDRMRCLVIEEAARKNIDIIFTGCYTGNKSDIKYFKKFKALVEKQGGKTLFVQLICDKCLLFKRIKGKSRERYGKIRHACTLRENLKKHDFFQQFPFAKSLVINNDKLSAKKAALHIIKHFKLKEK